MMMIIIIILVLINYNGLSKYWFVPIIIMT